MKTVRLITCDSLPEAYLIKGRLNNEGIDCFLTNQNFTNLMPLYNNMLGAGIQVIINDNDLIKAREVIKDKLVPGKSDLICQQCSSNEITLSIGKSKGLKILNMFMALLLLIPMGNLKPKYYCKKCKTEIK